METLLGKHWHAISRDEASRFLETDPETGLDRLEIKRRQTDFGPNVITSHKKQNPFMLFLRQFHQALVYILIAAGLTTVFLHEWIEAVFIFGVVIVNAVIGFFQEYRAVEAMAALAETMETEATVVRAGKKEKINAESLVPGDMVWLQGGDKVPADLRLYEIYDLRIDESALTGESVPVDKQSERLDTELSLADRKNMAYASTLVTYGRGLGVVVSTGDKTEVGRISKLIASATELKTPLTRKISQFSRYLLIAILVLAAVTFCVGLLRGEPLFDMFLAAVALAVGSIPEGMPAAITIMLAIGVSRMARRQSIIRKLPAVETLGGTTIICSDKTGTLTENQMTVQEIQTIDNQYLVSGIGYEPKGRIRINDPGNENKIKEASALDQCLTCGVLCNDSSLVQNGEVWKINGDPTEAALLVSAKKAGMAVENLFQSHVREDELPFDSARQFMATLNKDPQTGHRQIYVKGSVESVLDQCRTARISNGDTVPLDRETALAKAAEMAARGLRVLTFAISPVLDGEQGIEILDGKKSLIFLGFQAMLDPPRDSSAKAIQTCHRAGVSVKMITGDHALTATAIAKRLDMLNDRDKDGLGVVTGSEIGEMRDDELIRVAEENTVFARVSPEQKLHLVEALQENSHVVAMTGDGVNDAPALRQADIGVAMGKNGTEVAKDASDMVLLDDNFATIVSAVEEGRGVYDNLIKFIVWTLPTNLGEGLVILAAVIFGVTLPILPIQILWINMSTALLLGMMLAFEPREPDIMNRPPRDPKHAILDRDTIVRIFFVGFLMLIGAFGLFELAEWRGYTVDRARTIAVNVFIFIEIFYLFNCRSLEQSVFRIGLFTNRLAFLGAGVMVLLQMVYTYFPPANRLFQSAPLSVGDWIQILLYSVLVFWLVEMLKSRLYGKRAG